MAIDSNSIVRLGLDSNKYEKGIREAKKQWEDFTKSMGLSTSKITAIGAAIGAVTAAIKVSRDAFRANEAVVDEWGRTVNSAKGMYEGFLNALNNGDISGYLRNIDNIVNAARKAYDEMDRLGTMRTIQAPEISKQQTENERLRSMIRTGRYIAPLTGGGEAGMVNGQQLTAEQIRVYEELLNNGVNKVVDLMSNEIRQTSSAIDAIYNSMATNMRMSIDEFRLGTSSMAEFDKRIQGAQNYRQYISDNTVTTISPTTGIRSSYYAGGRNPYEQYAGWDVFRVDGEKFKELVNLISTRNQQASGVYGQMAQAYQTINRAEGTTVRSIMGGGAASSATAKQEYIPLAGSIDAQIAKVKELQEAFNAAGSDGIRMGLLPQLKEAEQTLERMKNQADMWIDPNSIALPSVGLSKIPTPTIDNSDFEKSKALAAIAEKNRQEWIAAANAISEVGSALQGIEDPAAKVVGIIGQAVATIALSFAQAMKVAAETTGPWGWLAFAATGTATMISTIAAIKQATAGSFAEGGVIKGNHYSNDMMLARVNAGETILTASQTGTLAARLQGDSLANNMHLTATISGEQIRLALNNYGRRTGRGEYITTNFR